MKSISIRSLVYVALFAALFIVLSMQQMKLNFSVIPITLQTFAVILSGLFLRPRLAFASIFVVIILSAFGLPLFGGKGGIPHLIGPTGGFIIAFPFCAMFASIAVHKLLTSKRMISNKVYALIGFFLIFFILCSMLSYVPGLLWMKYTAPYSWAKTFIVGSSFLPGDAIKAFIGSLVAVSLASFVYRFRSADAVETTSAAPREAQG
ncbi:biotin transporter BioY [Paenibacillus sp. 1011MAR3C5]|uniref:biotin transporter BioY n=1 Tax=Paenibacillus sp. 1011MAR3C5 TaxID=1675787 RepID=UPI000E6C5075|nr:biotin transporter BioY [Paenibacillus sp. 1011MAR3C5]RJE86838.1 biotin transporter BioY [Paenibacillus sp. 1011MAR3C5]